MGNQLVPAGAIQYFARKTAPEGWLVADGREVSRTQYPDLFAAIRVEFGMGDGIDTFKLPDLRGEFIRGLDGGRGVDAGRQFGSIQIDDFKSHIHLSPTTNGVSQSPGREAAGNSGCGYDYGDGVGSIPTLASGGTETRPRNIALLACIKY